MIQKPPYEAFSLLIKTIEQKITFIRILLWISFFVSLISAFSAFPIAFSGIPVLVLYHVYFDAAFLTFFFSWIAFIIIILILSRKDKLYPFIVLNIILGFDVGVIGILYMFKGHLISYLISLIIDLLLFIASIIGTMLVYKKNRLYKNYLSEEISGGTI